MRYTYALVCIQASVCCFQIKSKKSIRHVAHEQLFLEMLEKMH